ncbi:hypothetical protein ACFHYQ_17585 [Sphaerimonospora cavernae]|uniref:Peptidase MA-like domain-containing protein n=1 Tax=Sphaerimonospora cavernae TaxID=1740611 RepID=A0ABV6U6N2_9ACTN
MLLLGGVAAVLVVTAAVVVAVAFPSVAATICPGCYRMERLGPGLYVESGLSDAQRRQVVAIAEQANQRVSDFYGGRESSPRILACLTDECYRRIGGGRERGIAVLDRAVMLSPRGIDPVIAAHELSHVELHARLGGSGSRVPQWFDEGLAVLVSDDPRYLAPKTAGDRCLVDSREALPVTLAAWLRAAFADQRMYGKAACQVSRKLGTDDPRGAALRLIKRLSGGDTFAASW